MAFGDVLSFTHAESAESDEIDAALGMQITAGIAVSRGRNWVTRFIKVCRYSDNRCTICLVYASYYVLLSIVLTRLHPSYCVLAGISTCLDMLCGWCVDEVVQGCSA